MPVSTAPNSRPSGPSDAWTQEIRFAGVFFGGVSLAIYMNGVAQELFRMVRSTADLDPSDLDPVEKIYREIGQILYLGRTPPDRTPDTLPPRPAELDPVRTRFVIDILSGTSAGGINAVALAKALALRLKDMNVLASTWRDDADLQTLLNDGDSDLRAYPKPNGNTTSLLNSEKMYAIIHRTLADMNKAALPADGRRGFADEIDLFVTATDLNGLWRPIQLADKTIDERMHKTVFRFRYADAKLEQDLGMEQRNHFTSEFDPMLAFAARCTSAFPVAFEPMTLEKIEPTLKRENLGSFEDAKETFKPFFADYIEKAAGARQVSFERRLFADGGYLDNKPFSYAIEMIRYRTARLPVTRKLFYLDPFPENAADRRFRDKITFVENAQLAAMSLPRYETVRGDIQAINESNRLQERLDMLCQNVHEYADGGNPDRLPPKFDPDGTLTARAGQMPGGYAVYHQLRVAEVTDAIAVTITRVADFNEESDQFAFVRSIARAWREATYDREKRDGRISENRFLHDFDLAYRLRRLSYVRQKIKAGMEKQLRTGQGQPDDPELYGALQKVSIDVEKELLRLRQGGATLCSPRRSPPPLKEAVVALRDRLFSGNAYATVMEARNRDEAAKGIYQQEDHGKAIRAIAKLLKQELANLFGDDQAIEAKAAQWPAEIFDAFRRFVYRDTVTVPFLFGTDVQEYTRTEVYRIGPADAGLRPNDLEKNPQKKLAGSNALDFGGFMSSAWRENDMMWGRLDAADRIVTALLPAKTEQPLRDHYIRRLQDAILEQEISINRNNRIAWWFLNETGLDRARRQPCDAKQPKVQSSSPDDSKQPEVRSPSLVGRVMARIGRAIIPGLKERDLLRQAMKLLKETPAGMLVRNGAYRDFVEAHYRIPPWPPTDTLTSWIGRALTILGNMVDDDVVAERQKETPVGRALRTLGVTATKVVRFAMPNTLRQRVVRDWLGVLAISGVPLILFGLVLGKPDLTSFGTAAIIVFLLLIVLQQWIGIGLSQKTRRKRALQVAGFVVVVVAAVFMLLSLAGGTDLWSRAEGFLNQLTE